MLSEIEFNKHHRKWSFRKRLGVASKLPIEMAVKCLRQENINRSRLAQELRTTN